jgi:putative acetyltransferase
MMIEIREWKEEDLDSIIELLNKDYPYVWYKQISPDEIKEVYQRVEKKGMKNFVCEVKGKIRGFVGLGPREGRQSHICSIFIVVDSRYQDRGIGTILLQRAIKYTKKKGFKKLITEVVSKNSAAIRLYRKLRFKKEAEIEKSFRLDNGEFVDTFIMSKWIEERPLK